ncbi:hypothetical protein JNM87_01255 [Candidatus Saccharibacteria bacterium]|nr:hypothetical protein [Candidatus Saccharibacteria bacterium]
MAKEARRWILGHTTVNLYSLMVLRPSQFPNPNSQFPIPMRRSRIVDYRGSDTTKSGHAEAPGGSVVGFDNFRKAMRVV